MTTENNPLLDFSDLPRFDLIRTEHVRPAVESLLADGRALIARLTAETTPATWSDFAGALPQIFGSGTHELVAVERRCLAPYAEAAPR